MSIMLATVALLAALAAEAGAGQSGTETWVDPEVRYAHLYYVPEKAATDSPVPTYPALEGEWIDPEVKYQSVYSVPEDAVPDDRTPVYQPIDPLQWTDPETRFTYYDPFEGEPVPTPVYPTTPIPNPWVDPEVRVTDVTAPTLECVAGPNPGGKTNGSDSDGFFQVMSADSVSAVDIKLGSFTLVSGETIKITQAPGKSGVTLAGTMRGTIRHFIVGPGDATITSTDAAGNTATVVCPVPPNKK